MFKGINLNLDKDTYYIPTLVFMDYIRSEQFRLDFDGCSFIDFPIEKIEDFVYWGVNRHNKDLYLKLNPPLPLERAIVKGKMQIVKTQKEILEEELGCRIR